MDAEPPFDRASFESESLRHFRALLRIDTTNPPGSEAVAVEYLSSVLKQEAIEHAVVESAPGRSSLVARLKGQGNRDDALLLNGHLDVVPADPRHWRFDPFSAQVSDGYVWGRGAIDMKNMVAMSLMTLIAIKRSKAPLARDIVFAAVADEEAGCDLGSLFLVEKHPELVESAYVLNEVGGQTVHVGKQRFYPIQVAEKGVCWFELTADGSPGHGSMPHGDNAVSKIARAVERLSCLRLSHEVVPEVSTFLRTIASGSDLPTSLALRGLLSSTMSEFLLGVLRRNDPDKASAFSAMLGNTVSPTMLNAGIKENVIPALASARLDGRVLPGIHVNEFIAQVRRVIGDDVRLNILQQHDGVRFPVNTPLYEEITRTLHRFDPGSVVVPYMNPAFTDSFAYARVGAVCYGFAPVRLGPELNFSKMFHGHDERIPIAGYLWGQRALLATVANFCCESAPAWIAYLHRD